MNKFRIYVNHKYHTTLWAVDAIDARARYAKRTGIDLVYITAEPLITEERYE